MNEPEPQKDITPIVKAVGVNNSEKILARLCDEVFLKLWAYPNPYGEQGNELCDVLAVFENHVFIFSIKDILFNTKKPPNVAWDRWKRKAIDESIKQVRGAEKWIRKNPEKIFLDAQCTEKFPLPIDIKNLKIHRIVVAHGAEEACKKYSSDNIHGSLGVSYSDSVDSKTEAETIGPFTLMLNREKIVHVFDSHNLGIILAELDTVRDLLWYFEAKEHAIKKYRHLACSGEEELLANYFCNFDKKTENHYIGEKNKKFNTFMACDGLWQEFTESEAYQRKKAEDEVSYLWDELLQKTLQHALDGTLTGNANAFKGKSASVEMAKEPRFSRREIIKRLKNAIHEFSSNTDNQMRHIVYFSSYYPDLMYVFFQMPWFPNMDYEKEYRPMKRGLLSIACGMTKNKFPHLKKVIGITMDPPKPNQRTSEDFILMDCEDWTEERAEYYRKENKETGLNTLGKKPLKMNRGKAYEFPPAPNHAVKTPVKTKPQRNDPCPCGSGKKYKRCCYLKGF